MHNLRNRVARLRRRLLLDLGGKDSPVVWVVGDGRSGTTWLSNLINYRGDYRYMFEPFHPAFVSVARGYPLFHYLRPEATNPEFLELYRRIFSGHVRDERVDRYNWRLAYRKRLVKDVFANLFIKWADVHFPAVKKIWILRHPFDVAISKEKLKRWVWMVEPRELLLQRDLYEDHLQPFRSVIDGAQSYFEKQIVLWCVAHYVPLKQLHGAHVHLAFYEDLCTNPESEIRRLLEFLGDDPPGESLDPRLLAQFKTPSDMSREQSAIRTKDDLIGGWQRALTDQQVDAARQVLQAFGLDGIYGDRPSPDRATALGLMGAMGSERPAFTGSERGSNVH